MLYNHRNYAHQQLRMARHDLLRSDRSLQICLWLVWSLAVVGSAYVMWHGATLAGAPVDLVRLALRTALVGVLGLLVMTKVEMTVEPWRFVD